MHIDQPFSAFLSRLCLSVKCLDSRLLINNGQLKIAFRRTLRVPDDGRTHLLPKSFGRFPVQNIAAYQKKIMKTGNESLIDMARKGGVFFPIFQREALWISFDRDAKSDVEYKVRVFQGGVNVVTGRKWNDARNGYEDDQDYVLVPPQKHLDGIAIGNGVVRQFVAMPIGSGYSIENQITGKEDVGGLQIEVSPQAGCMCVTYGGSLVDWQNEKHPESVTPRDYGLVAGQMLELSRSGLRDSAPFLHGRVRRQQKKTLMELVNPNYIRNKDISNTSITALYNIRLRIEVPGTLRKHKITTQAFSPMTTMFKIAEATQFKSKDLSKYEFWYNGKLILSHRTIFEAGLVDEALLVAKLKRRLRHGHDHGADKQTPEAWTLNQALAKADLNDKEFELAIEHSLRKSRTVPTPDTLTRSLITPDSLQRSHLPSVLAPEAAVPQTEQTLFSVSASPQYSVLPSTAPTRYGPYGFAKVEGVNGATQGEQEAQELAGEWHGSHSVGSDQHSYLSSMLESVTGRYGHLRRSIPSQAAASNLPPSDSYRPPRELCSTSPISVTTPAQQRLKRRLDKKTVESWAMGLAPGGKLTQQIYKDEDVHRPKHCPTALISVQLLNAVAYEAITGIVCAPTHIRVKDYVDAKLPWFDTYDSSSRSTASGRGFEKIQSVSEIDGAEEISVGINVAQSQKIGCTMCHRDLCDCVLRRCNHAFCSACVKTRMVYRSRDGPVVRCAMCCEVAEQVLGFSAPMALPGEEEWAPNEEALVVVKTGSLGKAMSAFELSA